MTEDEKKAHPLYDLYLKYREACQERDAVYEKVRPLEDQLTKVNAQIETLRAKQGEIVAKIDAEVGLPFVQLKKRIATMARALGSPGGLLAS